ncbi:hypothetical protein BR1R5_18030 [Pseudomonas sp. BR1R-5]|nr:hypothetical protein BR1R5_18030 [Pseudomonas sp. BR1R-5]
MQQLAAWHAVGVEDEQFEQLDIGVFGKETSGVFNGGKVHEGFARVHTKPPLGGGPAESIGRKVAGLCQMRE